MKTLNTIIKILTALAAVAGAIYVAATYGEQIVAWCKKVLASMPKCPCCCQDADVVVEAEEAPIPDAPVEEEDFQTEESEESPVVEAEEDAVEEIPLTPAPNEPVAEEQDFAE